MLRQAWVGAAFAIGLGVPVASWAGCTTEKAAYESRKIIVNADKYIACLVKPAAVSQPMTPRTGGGLINPNTPVIGPAAPGNPRGHEIAEKLNSIKSDYGISDVDWASFMLGEMDTTSTATIKQSGLFTGQKTLNLKSNPDFYKSFDAQKGAEKQ